MKKFVIAWRDAAVSSPSPATRTTLCVLWLLASLSASVLLVMAFAWTLVLIRSFTG